MHRFYLLCQLLLLVAATGSAQKIRYFGLRADTGTIYLRHNPLGWIDVFDGNVTLGAEYRFNRTWSATMDAGYIFYSAYLTKAKLSSGLLLRPGIRVYPGRFKDYFFDLQLHYKEVTYHVKDWIERDVTQGVASYEELTKFRYRKRVMGLHLMGGVKQYFTNNRRFFMEIYLGLGVHFRREGPYHQPPDSRYDQGFVIFQPGEASWDPGDNPQKTIVPAVPGGLRIIYRLR
jgi:hypothetical protein